MTSWKVYCFRCRNGFDVPEEWLPYLDIPFMCDRCYKIGQIDQMVRAKTYTESVNR